MFQFFYDQETFYMVSFILKLWNILDRVPYLNLRAKVEMRKFLYISLQNLGHKIGHFFAVLHRINKQSSQQYQLRMLASSCTIRFWKESWTIVIEECPAFLGVSGICTMTLKIYLQFSYQHSHCISTHIYLLRKFNVKCFILKNCQTMK